MTMPQYHIWTIGCQMNKAESERLGAILEQRGYQAAATPEQADLVVVNSCVVRQSAENRVTNRLHLIRQLKRSHPGMIAAVTGCFVDSEVTLKKTYPQIDYFFKAGDLPQWLEDIKPREALSERPPVSVYVPIMQGCNNFCTYCIVPFRRGRERSRPMAELVSEASELVRRGAREVVLLGQNVDSYGRDLPEGPDLASLLEELNGIDGLLRLRFLTSHPKDMTRGLIARIASLDKVCAHVNLPVQSGDDGVLELMRRGYTVGRYRQLIAEVRREIPGVALSTDVIVGFPSETEQQFQHTADLLSDLRLDAVHVACYSPRAGTYASKHLADDVTAREKSRRLKVIEDLQERILREINEQLLGQVQEVLVEGKTRGKWRGRTRSDKLVFFNAPGNYVGRLVRVRVEKTGPWALQGQPEMQMASAAAGDKEEE
jgi:tRNA-2-methylthio-N6-dimethylallyladenosine synthase